MRSSPPTSSSAPPSPSSAASPSAPSRPNPRAVEDRSRRTRIPPPPPLHAAHPHAPLPRSRFPQPSKPPNPPRRRHPRRPALPSRSRTLQPACPHYPIRSAPQHLSTQAPLREPRPSHPPAPPPTPRAHRPFPRHHLITRSPHHPITPSPSPRSSSNWPAPATPRLLQGRRTGSPLPPAQAGECMLPTAPKPRQGRKHARASRATTPRPPSPHPASPPNPGARHITCAEVVHAPTPTHFIRGS
jgi:hypothetical protein